MIWDGHVCQISVDVLHAALRGIVGGSKGMDTREEELGRCDDRSSESDA